MTRCKLRICDFDVLDESFVNMFLVIYRRFARPYEVLAKLVQRYEYVEAHAGSEPVLAKYAHMKWVSSFDLSELDPTG